jgi:hypothetical protein
MTEMSLVDRLWGEGPAPAEGPSLLGRAQEDHALLVFAGLAQLADDRVPVGPTPDADRLDAPTRALLLVVERWQQLDPEGKATVADGQDARWGAVAAWSRLVQSLGQLSHGYRSAARHRLLRLLADTRAPARARVVAGWAAARPEAHASSGSSVRIDALVDAARIAREVGWEEHADFAELAVALLDVEHRRIAAGHERLQRLLAGQFGDNALGVALRSSMALELPFAQASELLRHGLESAARRGDDWAYATIIKAAANMYLLESDHASAVLVLSSGMKQLERASSPCAGDLRNERAGLSQLLGEGGYRAACEQARVLLASDQVRLPLAAP